MKASKNEKDELREEDLGLKKLILRRPRQKMNKKSL
jgi:hypothetical protein